jgi:hypothetical protein
MRRKERIVKNKKIQNRPMMLKDTGKAIKVRTRIKAGIKFT